MSRRRLPFLTAMALLMVVAAAGCTSLSGGKPHPTAAPIGTPDATPLAEPPAAPAGDGTTVTLSTTLGDIVIEIYNLSSPVAATNFVNLAESRYYDGIIFHRVIPGFVVQGGDPEGMGGGGPGYTIRDEPVVGDYLRGIVAMARAQAPDSQGSQFFFCLEDLRERLDKAGGYAIFGNVIDGMDMVDAIASQPTDPTNARPLDPVVITGATVNRP